MGSDTGGSIRVPAALCGVVGLKPTYGRVNLRGVMPLSWNLDHAGPMARRVLDVAIMLQLIAGFDEKDPASLDIPVDDYISNIDSGVKGWRIAIPEDQYFQKSTADVLQAVRQAANVYESLGANIETVEFPWAYQAASANGMMVIADAAAVYQDALQDTPNDFGQDVLHRLQIGAELPVGEYILARRTQVEMRRQFERFFDRYDILLLPTTAVTAPMIEGPDALAQARLLTRYTAPFNLTGLPALSLPGGFDAEGLPVGLQLVSRPWAEAAILRAAFAYEQETRWHLRNPMA
jgi:aspartyl-tRNA(Asn)/glutamyl-tRNA(Gln) amidotransferase subunit A